jgi:hypothetical protein
MKACCNCKEAKPLDAFSKNAAKPDGRHPVCKPCDADKRAQRRAANLGTERARDNARYVLRRDEKRAYDRAYYAQNAERIKAAVAGYAAENRGSLRPYNAQRQMKRTAKKRQQTPPWFDHAKAAEVYLFAEEFRAAGFDVEVDHIVPLQGQRATGLHWHGNLRVCLRGVNRSKSNKLIDDLL